MSYTEQHYTPAQLAEKWGFCANTIRDLFQNEKDVIRIGSPETRFKRKHIQMRIPESAAERVYRRITGHGS
jgi:hypothetical protein